MSPVVVDDSPDPHKHEWTWGEPIGLPGMFIDFCKGCGQRKGAFHKMDDDFELAPNHPPFAPVRGFAHGQHCRPVLALVHRLREYARHAPLCAYAPTYPDGDVATCDCGFDAVLDDYDRWAST